MTEAVPGFPLPPGPGPIGEWVAGPVLTCCNRLIAEQGGRALDDILLDWSLRGRTAGTARMLKSNTGLVRLNRQLFDYPENDYLELRDTILHEVAHLGVMATTRRAQPHGAAWRRFAASLGARARATHQLPLQPTRRSLEYGYAVADHLVWLGPVRHQRLQSGRCTYRVRRADGVHEILPRQYTGRSRRRGTSNGEEA